MAPFRTPPPPALRRLLGGVVAAHPRGTRALARAGLGEPVDHRGEHVELLGVLVLGPVVLARDRPQHVHRDLVGLAGQRPELLRVVEVDHARQTQHASFHDADGPEVAVPPLDRVLLDEAVAAEQLDAVEADLHALVGAQLAGEGDLAGEVLAGRGAGGGLVGQQPHRLQLDRDVGDHERHRLAVGDRLAERLALLDVRRHVVEHGLGRCRRPARTRRGARAARTRRTSCRRWRRGPRRRAPGRSVSVSLVREAARTPIAGSPSTSSPGVPDSTRNSTGVAVELGADDEQLGLGAARHERLHAVEDVAVGRPRRGGRGAEHVEQHGRARSARARRRGRRRR